MYATGYSIHPLRSSRELPLRHLGRWAVVLVAVVCVSLGLSKVGDAGAVQAVVVVQPGDTLWGIASAAYPGDDVRVRVDEIERLNGLAGPQLEVGETLRLPA